MAKKERLQRSELFRLKTLYHLPRRHITRIAASTYWQLAQQADSLERIAAELEMANQDGHSPKSATLRELRNALDNNIELLTQTRKELVDLDLMAHLSDEEDLEVESDRQANQG